MHSGQEIAAALSVKEIDLLLKAQIHLIATIHLIDLEILEALQMQIQIKTTLSVKIELFNLTVEAALHSSLIATTLLAKQKVVMPFSQVIQTRILSVIAVLEMHLAAIVVHQVLIHLETALIHFLVILL